MLYYIFSVLFFVFVWCPCKAINNVSVQYNGELLPDILLLTHCYHHRGTRLNATKRFCICSLSTIPPKRFYIFPPDWGMLIRSRRVHIFLLKKDTPIHLEFLVKGKHVIRYVLTVETFLTKYLAYRRSTNAYLVMITVEIKTHVKKTLIRYYLVLS